MTDHTPAPRSDGAGQPGRNVEPNWFARRIMNPSVLWLAKRGISVLGTRVLEVQGRSSGQWRSTVVNLLDHEGTTYLVAPRGHTQWVRNLRVAGRGRLRLGRRARDFTAIEVPDGEKVPVLREYLRRWGWEVGQFFEDLDRHASDADLARVAPGFPVFLVSLAGAEDGGGARMG